MVKTAISFGFKYGIYLGIFLILFGLVFNLGKFHYKSSLGYIFYLAVPVVIFLSLRAYLTNEGILTFGKGVSVSSIVAVVGCLLYGVYVFIYNTFVDDSLLQLVREDQLKLLESLDLAKADLARRVAQIEFQLKPVFFALSVFVRLTLIGVILSLVIVPIINYFEKS